MRFALYGPLSHRRSPRRLTRESIGDAHRPQTAVREIRTRKPQISRRYWYQGPWKTAPLLMLHVDLPWEESDTSRVWNHTGYPPGQPGNAGFPPMSSPFGSDMPPNFPPSGYPGGQGYPQFSSMAPAMGGVQASSMQPDFRGGPHYTMSSQAPREYPPGGYYPTSGGFDSAPRVTREPGGPSYYPPGAGPSQEPPRGGGFYDPSMDMTGTRGGDYGMANRPPPNGSPYDPGNREPYVSRQPPQDPYASRGGRRPWCCTLGSPSRLQVPWCWT